MSNVEVLRRGGVPQLAKYQIREEIGRGGMATVYRALDTRLGREVAIKVIHPHLRDSAEVATRFHTEATAVAKLRHENIVEVYDVSGPEETERYLVVELVDGTTLRRLLTEHGAMPPEVAAAFALELLDALDHAHAAAVVHRDIKPENVLVARRPRPGANNAGREPANRVSIKLADFGIAKLLDAQGVTSTGQVLGSPAHMAPEQIEGAEVDARSDVFGLGVLLYECLVGHLPFEGANPAQVLRRVLEGRYPAAHVERPQVGARWSAIVDRALAHARADRYPSAAAMGEAIEAELARLGFSPGAREVEAWLTDPAAYAKDHRSRLVERLCALGAEERKRRDALLAAADYNRALANAPDDPGLLRIVAGIHRAEARRRALERGALLLGAAGALAVVVWGGVYAANVRGARDRAALHALRLDAESAAAAAASAAASISPRRAPEAAEPSHRALDIRAPNEGMAPGASAVFVRPSPAGQAAPSPSRIRATPQVDPAQHRAAEPRAAQRALTFDMSPPTGVTITVDDQPSRPLSTGDVITVDGSDHVLVFSCPVCVTVRRPVGAGDTDETLRVAVPVQPGTLVIDGTPGNSYQLVEHPELVLRAGANAVPLRSAFERVTVKEMETGTTVTARLEAGKAVQATFAR